MPTYGRIAAAILFCVCQFFCGSSAAHANSLEWIRQLGTGAFDVSYGAAADSKGNVYVTGATSGSLAGPNAGGSGSNDAFLYKYNAQGSVVWSRQLGTAAGDRGFSVATDSLGQIYIAGDTSGALGGASAGGLDAIIAKYDASGNVLWTRQLGTAATDAGWGITTDGLGNVYVGGSTSGNLNGANAGSYDGFIRKYNSAGNPQWTRQFGSTKEDLVNSISADAAGNVYVSGATGGTLGGANLGQSDAFVVKYDSQGNSQWTKQFGTARADNSLGASVDGQGNLYVTGYNSGDTSVPNPDFANVFLNKYDPTGGLLWSRSLGSELLDSAYSVSGDAYGNAYVAGRTAGALGGPNAGLHDVFVSKYNAAGDLAWTRQWGSQFDDIAYSVSADDYGNIFVSGSTFGDLEGANNGFEDAFVAKIIDPWRHPADFNGDGVVNGSDLAKWRADVGAGGGSDADQDFDTDGADFLAWQRAFGATVSSTAIAIPEPVALSICVTLALTCPLRRRRETLLARQQAESRTSVDRSLLTKTLGGLDRQR